MRIFILHEKENTSQMMSLFETAKDKEPHILRRWENEDWRGRGVKGWYNITANPMMNTCERE